MAGKGREGGGLDKKGCFAIYFLYFGLTCLFSLTLLLVMRASRYLSETKENTLGGTKNQCLIFVLFVKM